MNKHRSNLYQAIWDLEEKFPQHSMRIWLSKPKQLYTYLIPFSFIIFLYIAPNQLALGLFFILNIIYLLVQLFKLIVIIIGTLQKEEKIALGLEKNLPIYTILLPIYKEDSILKNLVEAITKLDYPTHLLDVTLLIEADDFKTMEAIDNIVLPNYFEIIKIPIASPRTKPKACNYGLKFARGKYVVVYDAEDRPHPQQLKQAVAKFAISNHKVICIQAKLNYYNRKENILTKLFAIEYGLLFNYTLLGLKKLGMPIALGGTSNHFILTKLEELGAWDAFNVTEDADLGIRLYHEGYHTELIESLTSEEAPIHLNAWIKQRARWIKGHILTSLLHLKTAHNFTIKETLGIYLCLYLPNLIYLLLPIYLSLALIILETNKFDPLWYINLGLGIIMPISYSIFIILTKKWYDSIICIIFIIFYQCLLIISGIKACWQIFTDPYRWDKTKHGVSKYLRED